MRGHNMNFDMELFQIVLVDGEETLSSISSEQVVNLKTNNNTSGDTISLTTPITLSSQESVSLSLKVSHAVDFNTYIGLTDGAVTYSVVPEPATASLSLLGLAALMIRRRR